MDNWSWAQTLTWCVTAICITLLFVAVSISGNETSRANCERRATMIEKLAEDGSNVIIVTDR